MIGNPALSKYSIRAAIVFLLLCLASLVCFSNLHLAILVLVCTLSAVRLLYGEQPNIKAYTLRSNGRSLTFSDDKRQRFIALSIVEAKSSRVVETGVNNSEEAPSKIVRATKILAEHVGAFSIEFKVRAGSIRYLAVADAKTVAEACQKSETSAERLLRVVREMHGVNSRAGILEGEYLRDTFMSIVGGDFGTLKGVGNVVLREGESTNGASGFALLTAIDGSIGTIGLDRLSSIVQDLQGEVTYVISMKVHKTYDENVLIEGAEHGQIWVISSYFMVDGRSVDRINQDAFKLRSSVESLTRGGTLRVERGAFAIQKIGSILVRSSVGKKLRLSNNQLIAHIRTMLS